MRSVKWVLILILSAVGLAPAQKRVLYVMHSAGYHHESTLAASKAFNQIAARTGKFDVTTTTDVSTLNAANLGQYDAVFFFTSGELPISDQQKRDLLDFVLSGKGFGGAHSATDTLYGWPEYGELIGGYFDGHPWVKEVGIDVEDPAFAGLTAVAPNFAIVDEIYQIRDISRDRVRVLMTLDTNTVDLSAPGVNRSDGDFALAWIREYGKGRVFYTALGHLDETWQDERFQGLLEGALLWMTGQIEADALPRSGSTAQPPLIGPNGVAPLVGTGSAFAPGSLVAVRGERLTNGSTFQVTGATAPRKLVGTRVELNGVALPIAYASPFELHVMLPNDLSPESPADLRVASVGLMSEAVTIRIVESAPVLVAAERRENSVILQVTGLGVASTKPLIRINGAEVAPNASSASLTRPGIREFMVPLRESSNQPLDIEIEWNGITSNRLTIEPPQ